MEEARIVSGSDVDRLIIGFRLAAATADRHADHSCAPGVFAAGYAAAMATVLQALGLSEDEAFGPDVADDYPRDVTVHVESTGPHLTVADIDATDTDELISAILGREGDSN